MIELYFSCVRPVSCVCGVCVSRRATWGELLWKKYFFTDVPELLGSIKTYV